MVSVLVLIVIALLSLAGFAFAELMLREHQAARVSGDRLSAQNAAWSGGELVARLLEESPAERETFGDLYDDPDGLRDVAVGQGRFSVVVPRPEEDGEAPLRFGLENESARLHLGSVLAWDQAQPGAGRASLMALPGMTLEVADALLDWLDADDATREFGAESEYYGSLEPPYAPRQGLPGCLEELLLVRGVSRRMLCGHDQNQNGRIDPSEAPEDDTFSGTSQAESLPPGGWSAWLTLYSAERVGGPRGEPPIDLNGGDLRRLHQELAAALGEPWANFTIWYRQFGPAPAPPAAASPASPATPARGLASARTLDVPPVDWTLPPRYRLASVYDLLGAQVVVPAGANSPARVLASPWTDQRDPFAEPAARPVLARLGVSPAESLTGRVNFWRAPREVLLAVPGSDERWVDALVEARRGQFDPRDPQPPHLGWLLAAGVDDVPSLRRRAPFLTAGGDVHRAQLVAQGRPGRAVLRAQVLFDATRRPCRMLDYEELSVTGRGWPEELLWGSRGAP